MTRWQFRLVFAVGALTTLMALADAGRTIEPQGSHYSSTVNGHKFLGASRVNIQDLSDDDAPTKTAKMQRDQNAVSLNAFRDPGETTLVDYPFKDIKLTKIDAKDPFKQGRLLYDVEFVEPKEALKEKLRLVWIPGSKDTSSSLRLLLLNEKNAVTQMVELTRLK